MVEVPPVTRSRIVTFAVIAVLEWSDGAVAVMVFEVQLVTVAETPFMVTVLPGGSLFR